MNCPRLIFTGKPLRPAVSSRSVCRHKNAGICRISTVLATSATDGLVNICQDRYAKFCLDLGQQCKDSSVPRERNEFAEVRFACQMMP